MARRGCLWFLRNLYALKILIIIVVAFVAPCYLLVCNTLESKCLYAICVMALIWLTEVIPISVTALFPVFLFPMIGLATGSHVCSKYVNDTSILFLGGLILAVAIEETGLHKRIAISIMRIVGTTPNMLILGLMLPTWFLSMWISNTATTSMMLPIITAVIDQVTASDKRSQVTASDNLDQNTTSSKRRDPNVIIYDGKSQKTVVDERDVRLDVEDGTDSPDSKKRKSEMRRFAKVLCLCVAYAANCGGVATLVGTPPNLLFQGIANEKYDGVKKGADSGITFANWMGFAILLSFIMLIISWLWLQLLFIRCGCCDARNRQRAKVIDKVIRKQAKQMGKITFAEVMVLILFIILALLWVFRDLPDINGWSLAFKEKYVRDSTASILIASLLFILPSEVPNVFCNNKVSITTGEYDKPTYKPILDWKVTAQKVPWGVILLLGGGFALADVSQTSGLSQWISCRLQDVVQFKPWVINLIISCVVAAATEVTSNTATANLLLPIMFDLAIGLKLHPLYLMISVCVACSFAFMLPVATPPNAIVFSLNHLKIYDMASAGFMMNIIGIGVLTLAVNTWATPIFGLDTIPDMFQNLNYTTQACAELCPV